MSQIAEPVIAGLEVVEHFGEAPEVLARLMAAPVVRARRPDPSLVDRLESEYVRCLGLVASSYSSFDCVDVVSAYSRALPLLSAALGGMSSSAAGELVRDALAAVAAADALGAGAAAAAGAL